MVDGSREVRVGPPTLPTGSDCPQAVTMANATQKAHTIQGDEKSPQAQHAPGCWYPQVSADPVVSLGQMLIFARFFLLTG